MARLSSSSVFSSFLEKIGLFGGICLCLACFFLPLSTSLLGAFTTLAGLCWLLSGQFLRLRDILVRYPAALASLVLFLFMIIAITYSPAEFDEALYALKKYRELLLFPIVITLFSISVKIRQQAENCFLTGCIALMAVSYFMAFDFLPEDHYGHSIVFHITHNFFMAVLAFWSLHRAVKSQIYRYMWLLIFFLATANLFYIAPGRTGMFIYVWLILLFLFQKLSCKKFFIGTAVFLVILSTLYLTSTNVQTRVHQVVTEIQHYDPGESRTSIGQRFDWWRNSISLIKQKPVLGHGTGSFTIVQKNLPDNSEVKETNNPHNEYLFITVQFGTAGLLLFLSIFIFLLLHARRIDRHERMLLQGTLTAMMTGCLINSFLFDSMQGHFFILLSAALITSGSDKKNLQL